MLPAAPKLAFAEFGLSPLGLLGPAVLESAMAVFASAVELRFALRLGMVGVVDAAGVGATMAVGLEVAVVVAAGAVAGTSAAGACEAEEGEVEEKPCCGFRVVALVAMLVVVDEISCVPLEIVPLSPSRGTTAAALELTEAGGEWAGSNFGPFLFGNEAAGADETFSL